MSVERPPIESFFSQGSSKPPIDSFFVGDGKTTVLPPKRQEESIYSKGGVYEQFGPRPRQFNPVENIQFGVFAPSASQPGSAMPVAGQMVGNMAGGALGPVGAAAGGIGGAMLGEGARQFFGNKMGVQDDTGGKQFKNVLQSSALAEGLGLGLYGSGKLIEKPLKKGAEKLMYNYLNPSKKLAQKNPDIANEALRLGFKGSHSKALGQVEEFIGSNMDDLNAIIQAHGDRKTGLKNAFKYLDDEIAKAKFAQAPDQVSQLEKLKNQFMEEFLVPEYGIESRQFVLGNSNKQVTPKLIRGKSSNLPRKKTGMTTSQIEGAGLKRRGKRIVTGSADVDNPGKVVAIRGGRKKSAIVVPDEKYSLRSPVKGPEYGDEKMIGLKNRPMTVAETQARKQAQYENLKTRRPGGAYTADTKSTDIIGRQAYARGLKDDVVETLSDIPEVSRINNDVSSALDIKEALANRLPVEMRSDVLSLSDSVLGGMAFADPKVLALAATRKALKTPISASNLAQGMYKQGNRLAVPYAERYSLRSSSPVVRALLADSLRQS